MTNSAPKEIELPALDVTDDDWERAKDNVPPHLRDAYAQVACRERQLLATIAERDASLTREREKDEEIKSLKKRLRNSQISIDDYAQTKRDCADLKQRADDLQQRAEKAIEILSRGLISVDPQNSIAQAIALLGKGN